MGERRSGGAWEGAGSRRPFPVRRSPAGAALRAGTRGTSQSRAVCRMPTAPKADPREPSCWRGHLPLDQLAQSLLTLLFMQSRLLLAFWAASTHCQLILNLTSTHSPTALSSGLLSSHFFAQHVSVLNAGAGKKGSDKLKSDDFRDATSVFPSGFSSSKVCYDTAFFIFHHPFPGVLQAMFPAHWYLGTMQPSTFNIHSFPFSFFFFFFFFSAAFLHCLIRACVLNSHQQNYLLMWQR